MKTYTAAQVSALKPVVFSAKTRTGKLKVAAYLRSNAVAYFKQRHPSVKEKDIWKLTNERFAKAPIDGACLQSSRREGNTWVDLFEIRIAIH